MRRLNVFIALLATLIVPATGLMSAAPAIAYSVSTVYRDCETNGQLMGHYSRAELQAALNNIPAQMAEYSACQAIIQRALLAASRPGGGQGGGGSGGAVGGGGGRNGGGGSAKAHAARVRAARSRLDRGKLASLGTAGGKNSVALTGSGARQETSGPPGRSLPAALLVVLILLALTALSGGAMAIRRRALTRQGT